MYRVLLSVMIVNVVLDSSCTVHGVYVSSLTVCPGSPERRQLNFSLMQTANRPIQGTPATALSRTHG